MTKRRMSKILLAAGSRHEKDSTRTEVKVEVSSEKGKTDYMKLMWAADEWPT